MTRKLKITEVNVTLKDHRKNSYIHDTFCHENRM